MRKIPFIAILAIVSSAPAYAAATGHGAGNGAVHGAGHGTGHGAGHGAGPAAVHASRGGQMGAVPFDMSGNPTTPGRHKKKRVIPLPGPPAQVDATLPVVKHRRHGNLQQVDRRLTNS